MILDGTLQPSILFIKRSEREGDPWSGQVAFPGGKMNRKDGSVIGAAIRETREEVGVDLKKDARLLGFLGSFRTHTGIMDVVPSVFLATKQFRLRPNEEVEGCRWVSIEQLQSSESVSTYSLKLGGVVRDLPAIKIEDYVIWGLTLRIIEVFLERIGA